MHNHHGLGEFGVVYRGNLTGWQGRITAEVVAIKTLKSTVIRCKSQCKKMPFFLGYFSTNDIDDLMRESAKLQRFDHPNVLSLIGVCIDAGEAPYIVMPFMINGSLLTYLRKERHQFKTITDTHEDENSMVCMNNIDNPVLIFSP